MKIVVSPAKSLDFESKLPTKRVTQPLFLDQAAQLNKKLESKSKKAISDLMHISDKLADLNYLRYKDFSTPFTPQNARPAVFAFAGDDEARALALLASRNQQRACTVWGREVILHAAHDEAFRGEHAPSQKFSRRF